MNNFKSIENMYISPFQIAALQVSELVANQNQLSRLNSTALSKCERLRTLRVEENCLAKEQFDKQILEVR